MGLLLTLNDILLQNSIEGTVTTNAVFIFPGMILGAFLCPLFLPFPGKKSPLLNGVIFVAIIIILQVILRSFGLDFYLNSFIGNAVIQLLAGIIYPLCYGLFFLSHLPLGEAMAEPGKEHTIQLSRFCTFFFAIALMVYYSARFFGLPFLEVLGLSRDPQKSISFVYYFILLIYLVIGGAAITCLILLKDMNGEINKKTVAQQKSMGKGNFKRSMILQLIGITMVYRIINSIMNMRMFPALNYSTVQAIEPVYIITFIVIPFFALASIWIKTASWSGLSPSQNIIRKFLPPSIVLFILFPCLPLFGDTSRFTLILDLLGGIFNNLIWVFFSAAIIEAYVQGCYENSRFRGFWFYGLSMMVMFTTILALFAFLLNRFIPPFSTEFSVLLACLTAAAFFLLSFNILFPIKLRQLVNTPVEYPVLELEEMFLKYGLTKREAEIAQLMLKEGLDSKKIAERIFIANITVKNHITGIYRKFNVKNRAEFMSLFLK